VILATVNEPDQKDFCLWFKGNLVFIIKKKSIDKANNKNWNKNNLPT